MNEQNLSIDTADSMNEIDKGEWNRLARNATVYSSHEWLSFIEHDEIRGEKLHVVVVRDNSGVLVGGLCMNFTRNPPDAFYDPSSAFPQILSGKLGRIAKWSPAVIAGGCSEFRGQVLYSETLSPATRSQVVRKLVNEAIRWTQAQGTYALWFPYLPLANALEVKHVLGDECLLLYQDVDMSLATRGSSFEDYLQWLPTGRRHTVRRERAKFLASGCSLSEQRLGSCIENVAYLNARLMEKYGHGFNILRSRTYLERQATFADSLSLVLACTQRDRWTGFCLLYNFADAFYGRVVGFDYDDSTSYKYPNLVFYLPLLIAYERRMRSIHLGLSTNRAKLMRGATPQPLYAVLIHPDLTKAMRESSRDYNRLAVQHFAEQFGSFVIEQPDFKSWLPE